MLKVYIEADSFEEPQPMELAEDAPVDRLVPALVRELEMPRIDRAGEELVYVLRRLRDGKVLSGNISLRALGIQPETYLALEAYVADVADVSMPSSVEKVPASTRQRISPVPPTAAVADTFSSRASARQPVAVSQDANFYSDQTIADVNAFIANAANMNALNGLDQADSANQPILPTMPATGSTLRPRRRWSRRAVFMLGGAALGVAGVSLTYAAFRSLNNSAHLTTGAPQAVPTTGTSAVPTTIPQHMFMPTRANKLLTFMQHRQTVRSVTWSPNGTMLASGANDKLVLTWDLAGKVQVRKGQDNEVRAVAWSPDGNLLAIGTGNQVAFLNAQNGATQGHAVDIHRKTVTTLAWSPRQPQMLVSAGLDKLAVVWNAQTFQPQTMFKMHATEILASSWASDNQTIGTSSMGGVIRVWTAQNGQQVHGFFSDNAVTINALAFNPVGMNLAAGGMDGVLSIWQNGLTCQLEGSGKQQGQCLDMPQRLPMHKQAIRAVAWSPDGRFLATGGDDGMLLVWYPTQSQAPLLKVQQANPILALAWSPDGQKLASASGNTVTIWALA